MKYYKPVCACGCRVDIEVSLTAEVLCPDCGEVITNKTKPRKKTKGADGSMSA